MVRRVGKKCGGFTYLTILFVVALMAGGLALVGEVWHTSRLREKEADLLFVGSQYRRAIMLYYETTPGPAKRYPRHLEDLVLDDRFPDRRRYLRRLYPDPITNSTEWGLVKAPDGGVMGVYSLSGQPVLKTGNFRVVDNNLEGGKIYSDWKFFHSPSPQLAPKPSAPKS